VANKERDAYPGDTLVIGADTVVALDDVILGKPKDAEDAFKMLKALSGREHEVYTGVSIISLDNRIDESFVSCTKVRFYPLTDDEIREYISTGEPFDKAGAYGIQGKGGLLVEGISGDYNNVVGLPIAELVRRIKKYIF
jgi:septum formation protein